MDWREYRGYAEPQQDNDNDDFWLKPFDPIQEAEHPEDCDYWTISGDCLTRYIMEPRTTPHAPGHRDS